MPGPGAYFIGKEEKKEVNEVISSKWLFRDKGTYNSRYRGKVKKLEDEFSQFIGTNFCLAVNSGTSALECALASLEIGPGDEVIVPAYTYISTISSIIFRGAIPILAEIDKSFNIDPRDVRKKITSRTKAILPVHMLGNPADLDEIAKVTKNTKIKIIEDSCQSLGGSFNDKKLGSYCDLGVFSLNIFKTITAGDGGLLVTDNKKNYEKAYRFHDQGIPPKDLKDSEILSRPFFGKTFRMNELTGAFALAQIRKLPKILKKMKRNKKIFKDNLLKSDYYRFRKINDKKGNCSTVIGIIFKNKKIADEMARKLGTKTLERTGLHVYNNMENLINKNTNPKKCPFSCEYNKKDYVYKRNSLKKTDEILKKSIVLSVGVKDSYLGSDFGVTPLSSPQEIENKAKQFNKKLKSLKK